MLTYPYGYARPADGGPQGMGTMLTLEQMAAKATVRLLDGEFRRRMFRMMECAAADGVPLGVGTGWRVQPTNPDGSPKPGFARPGNSNHESFPAGSGTATAVAADMVPNVSWPWLVRNADRFGLRTFAKVNDEPWHIQPAEIPASRSWRIVPWALDPFDLPPSPFDQQENVIMVIVNGWSQIAPGESGDKVLKWQQLVNLSGAGLEADGDYGKKSQMVCRLIRSLNGLPEGDTVDDAVWVHSVPKV